MKTNICLWMLLLLMGGCGDFLEESSQDFVRPSSLQDLEQMLLGDGYQVSHEFYKLTNIFTDNIENYGVAASMFQAVHDSKKWKYTWDKNMFTEAGNGYEPLCWEVPYKRILGCNIVLDHLDKMDGNARVRESVRGEALTLRAWYYLHLVNLFGIAYNQGSPATDPGVPLKLTSAVTDEFFTRNTVQEAYSRIEKDLLEGNRLLVQYNQNLNFLRIGHLAAKSMLSRMYLYLEDWDKALAYADSVLMEKNDLLDLNTVDWKSGNHMYYSIPGVYNMTTSDEVVWGRSETYTGRTYVTVPYIQPYTISKNFMEVYGVNENQVRGNTIADIRARAYLVWGMTQPTRLFYGDDMVQTSTGKLSFQGIRTAELYLNRAEAYIQKYLKEGNEAYRTAALADLNKLRRARFNNAYVYQEIDISDGQRLLEFCIDERRRELCAESNHRWCDLRRYGMTVEHVLVEAGRTTYTNDMSRYVLPIPELVLEQNPRLIQN